MGAAHEDRLRSLTVNDQTFLRSLLRLEPEDLETSCLDAKTQALVRLPSLVSLDAAPVSYQWCVDIALAAGASPDEIVGTLLAVAPLAGLARVVSAAPKLAVAIEYDVDAALEEPTRLSGVRGEVDSSGQDDAGRGAGPL
jgi:4-carboxymuconolactone decarboxylase